MHKLSILMLGKRCKYTYNVQQLYVRTGMLVRCGLLIERAIKWSLLRVASNRKKDYIDRKEVLDK